MGWFTSLEPFVQLTIIFGVMFLLFNAILAADNAICNLSKVYAATRGVNVKEEA